MNLPANLIILLFIPTYCVGQSDQKKQAEASLQKGVAFFHTINTHGGYVYNVAADLMYHT